MKWSAKGQKLLLPETENPEKRIEVYNSDDFQKVADQIERGELRLISLDRLEGTTCRGFRAGPGCWVFRVRSPKPEKGNECEQ